MEIVLSLIPIAIILLSLIVFKLSPYRAGAIALIASILIALFYFGVSFTNLSITLGKGLSLALYVLLIIWAAIFIYNLVDEIGALVIIKEKITSVIEDRFIQFIMLSWLFSSFLQGIAGFGVPVAIVTPILIGLGFNPLVSVSAVLIGHSWSISFGSMGSSFYTLSLVTGIQAQELGLWMLFFDIFAMILTGLSVSYLYGGKKYLVKGLPLVFFTTVIMSATLLLVIKIGLISISGLISALSGIVFVYIYNLKKRNASNEKHNEVGEENDLISFRSAVLPYSLVVILSLVFYFLPLNDFSVSFDFPGYTTMLNHVVKPETSYSKIKLFGHPAPIIIYASLISIIYYKRKNLWNKGKINNILNKTVNKCIGTTLSLAFLIPMAVVMMDSGIIESLAVNIAEVTNKFYPILSPLIGVLGSFITGSNTNSNVIFGSFQYSVAQNLSINEATVCAAQTIGASVGCSIGPTQVLLGTTSGKLENKEYLIYKRIVPKVLAIALTLGIINILLVNLL